ncbi:MAG: hypothetical protein AAF645_11380 [Myxococcota bacterium]
MNSISNTSALGRALSYLAAAALSAGVLAAAPTARAQVEAPVDGTVIPNAPPAREQTYETARGIGMGMGGRASAMGTSAAAYNAANLTLAPLYHIETLVGFIPSQRTWIYGGAIADSVSSRLAMGISWYGYRGNEERDASGYDGRLSLGMALTRAIGVGVSGRFIKLNPGLRHFTLDASLRGTLFKGLNVAALGYNLIRTDSPIAPLMVGGSVGYTYEQLFSINVDALADLTTFDDPEAILGVGAEVFAGGSVSLRVGYRREFGRDLNQFTASLGYVTAKVGVDIALRQDVGPVQQTRDSQLALTLRYQVQ